MPEHPSSSATAHFLNWAGVEDLPEPDPPEPPMWTRAGALDSWIDRTMTKHASYRFHVDVKKSGCFSTEVILILDIDSVAAGCRNQTKVASSIVKTGPGTRPVTVALKVQRQLAISSDHTYRPPNADLILKTFQDTLGYLLANNYLWSFEYPKFHPELGIFRI